MLEQLTTYQREREHTYKALREAGANDRTIALFEKTDAAHDALIVAMIAEIGIAQEHAHKAAIAEQTAARPSFVDQHGNAV